MTAPELSGSEKLWNAMSYTGWLALPRVLMQQMPDDWQGKMADLLQEYNDTWDIPKQYWCEIEVSLKKDGKYIQTYEWIKNYRHPDREMFESWKTYGTVHQRIT